MEEEKGNFAAVVAQSASPMENIMTKKIYGSVS
jgi:hypothetical protein